MNELLALFAAQSSLMVPSFPAPRIVLIVLVRINSVRFSKLIDRYTLISSGVRNLCCQRLSLI